MAIYVRDTTVYATEENKHKKTGNPIKTSKEMAAHLVNKGMASTEKPKGESKSAKA